MREKPKLGDEKIAACVRDEYGVTVEQVCFLPLGADQHTAVYRLVAANETCYFLKLRQGAFDETAVALARFLADLGIKEIISPLTTRSGRLWASLGVFRAVLYPFVQGRNGYEVGMSRRQWRDFGTALRTIHGTQVPPTLAKQIGRESFSPRHRDRVARILAHIGERNFEDPLAIRLVCFMRSRREEVLDLLHRADRLARMLPARTLPLTVCHSDLHAGNILIDTDGDSVHIVDWDNPVLAPKERDLMFIGGGLMGGQITPEAEEVRFYEAYGQTQIDPMALAYYRYERIIEDIAVICEMIVSKEGGDEDRETFLGYLKSNFLPKSTIEIAYHSDRSGLSPD